MKTGKKIIILSVLVFVFLPVFAHAVSWWPLVPCGTSVNPAQCTRCDLFRLLKNIIDFVLMGLMPPAAAILFVWGGFLILMGGANPGWISEGKKIFWNTAIGVAIISASWLITNTIIRSLAADNVASEWWKLECRVTVAVSPTLTPTPTESVTPTPTETVTPIPTGTITPTPIPADLVITTASLSDGAVGKSYLQAINISGGVAPYTWSIKSGSLPAGVSLISSGTVSGTPSTAGTATFTVEVKDSSSPAKSDSKQLTIKIVSAATASVTISAVASSNVSNTSAVITWTTDKPSTSQVAYGKTSAYDSSTTLNNNLVTSHSATITGLNPGTTYNFQAISGITGFTARSSNNTFQTTGTMTQPLSITTASLPDATQNVNYSQTLSVTGGTSPYVWSVSAGTLPAGLSLSGSTISGKPTTAGTSTFTVKAEDSSSPKKSATKQLAIKVATQAASVVISNVASSNVTNTSATITWTTDKPSTSQVAYGTTTAYNSPGSPTSIATTPATNHTINITGLTPGTSYNFQAVSGVTGFTARSSNYTFKTTGTPIQQLSITTTSLPNGTQNQVYSQKIQAQGGTQPYKFTVSSGTLPAGLILNSSNGTISGTPTMVVTSAITFKVEDSSPTKQSATKQLSIKISGQSQGAVCIQSGWNLCQPRQMTCSVSACSQYVQAINQNAGGAASANLLKAIMIKESTCNIRAASGTSYGLMQLSPGTVTAAYKTRCDVPANTNVDRAWLTNPVNATASICIAAEYVRALSQTSCGSNIRNLAAGYNGGSGACNQSVSCTGETSCDGTPVKKWECLYDDKEHQVCNGGTDPMGGYNQTRDYATKVLYCYNNPGF